MTTGEPEDRRGRRWAVEDYRVFFAALSTTATDQEIATRLGRTPGAVRSRAQFVLKDRYCGSAAMRKVRELAAQPDFDGLARAREAHSIKGYPFRERATDKQLILPGVQSQVLSAAELVEPFDVPERECTRPGPAASTAEVADRFGAEPGKVLDIWAATAHHSTSVTVGALVVTSSNGTVLHLSLHPDADGAAQARAELEESVLTDVPAAWTIVTGLLGAGALRATAVGVWAERRRPEGVCKLVAERVTAGGSWAYRRDSLRRLFRRCPRFRQSRVPGGAPGRTASGEQR